MKYRCLIIDDEPIAIRVVQNHLQNFPDIEVAGEFSNAIEALEFLMRNPVDLIFLDIQMPQITGLEMIQNLQHPPLIIFTTAYREFAVEAFDLNVVDYLLKPFSLARFAKAVGKFFQQMGERNNGYIHPETNSAPEYILIKADKKIYKIDLNEVIYLESLGDYVIVNTTTDKIITKERISVLYEKLPSSQFLRIHRSYVVSIRKIDAILAGCIEIGEKKLPIGRNYKNQVETFLNQNMHQ